MRLRAPLYNIPFVKTAFHLSKETVLHGSFQAEAGGRIDGLIKGDVQVNGRLVVGKSAEIRGEVFAVAVDVYGRIYGNIFCGDKAVIRNTAFIKGNITAGVIEVKEGALVEGIIIKKPDPGADNTLLHEDELPAGLEEQPVVVEAPLVQERSTDQDKNATTWF